MEGINTTTVDLDFWSKQPLIGYYWMSDDIQPVLFEEAREVDFKNLSSNSEFNYLVEAMFITSDKKHSLVIKTIDDKQFCYSIEWEEIKREQFEVESVGFVRDPINKTIQFRNIFNEIPAADAPEFMTREFQCRALFGIQPSKKQ